MPFKKFIQNVPMQEMIKRQSKITKANVYLSKKRSNTKKVQNNQSHVYIKAKKQRFQIVCAIHKLPEVIRVNWCS